MDIKATHAELVGVLVFSRASTSISQLTVCVTPSAAEGVPGRCVTWTDTSSRDSPVSDYGQHLLYLMYSLGAKMIRSVYWWDARSLVFELESTTGIFLRLQD